VLRIALARCLYRDADVYLWDDVLATLDPATAHALFAQALRGLRPAAARVLVTRTPWAFAAADRVMLLEGGRLTRQGTASQRERECVCVCVSETCIHIRTCTHLQVHTHIHAYIHDHICVCVSAHACLP
jgi:ABC-type protease/lipase transport system fused ATPase/permease subunit